jgi:hypothetical protein
MAEAGVFDVLSPLGFTVHCTRRYWEFIVTYKHPVLVGGEAEVAHTLAEPNEVRRSRKDPNVLLFYRCTAPCWLCAVAKHENGSAFLITSYPTDPIKMGETMWTTSK